MRGIGDALAFADAKLRGNKPLVLEAFGRCFVEMFFLKNVKQKTQRCQKYDAEIDL